MLACISKELEYEKLEVTQRYTELQKLESWANLKVLK